MVSADIEADSALTIARENRLDWMNERAILHDEWRRTGLYRNALRSSLDLVLAGDLKLVTATITFEISSPSQLLGNSFRYTCNA